MRVEQRIGRIDRLGQKHPVIRIVNLHYEGTVETDVYRVLRDRLGLFQSVVGPLQPILSRMPAMLLARWRNSRTRTVFPLLKKSERARPSGEQSLRWGTSRMLSRSSRHPR